MNAVATIDLTAHQNYAATLRSGISKLEFSPSTGGVLSEEGRIELFRWLHLLNQWLHRIAVTSQIPPTQILCQINSRAMNTMRVILIVPQ